MAPLTCMGGALPTHTSKWGHERGQLGRRAPLKSVFDMESIKCMQIFPTVIIIYTSLTYFNCESVRVRAQEAGRRSIQRNLPICGQIVTLLFISCSRGDNSSFRIETLVIREQIFSLSFEARCIVRVHKLHGDCKNQYVK